MGNILGKPDKTHLETIYDDHGEDALIEAIWKDIIKPEDYESLRNQIFDLDCLAFEGGGVKGTAYVGAVKVLEDLGILENIKRFAGTSAGSYMAMMVAIGMPADTIFKRIGIPNFEKTFFDSRVLQLPYNLLKGYGWHSGSKLLNSIEDDLEEFFGDRNATFLDLYKKRGVELCVVITDLNCSNVEYCHPKTLPGLKISEAVKTSMSLPFLFAPTTQPGQGMQRYFVDGGLLENFPVHVYDGWYLSMKKEDDFFERMETDSYTRFDGVNKKMLGIVLFSHGENQCNANVYLKRYGDQLLEGRPDSKLSREREYTNASVVSNEEEKRQNEESAKEIVRYIALHVKDQADEFGTISLETFKGVMTKLKDDDAMSTHLSRIMGKAPETVFFKFDEMDIDHDNRLSMVECLTYLHSKGFNLRYNLEARKTRQIKGMSAYVASIIEVMQAYIGVLQDKPENQDRTIGIYTDYVTTADADMSIDDKAYLLRQGYKAALGYFREMVKK